MPADPAPLAELLSLSLAAYQRQLTEAFPELWARVLAEAHTPAPVARLWSVYNEGYLLRGPSERAPLVAIDLIAPKGLPERAVTPMLETLPTSAELPLMLVTHRHVDHLDPQVVERLLAGGTTVAMTADAWDALHDRSDLSKRPAGLRIVAAGEQLSIEGVDVSVHAADHLSEKVKEAVAYEVRLGDVTVLHAADHRAFDSRVEEWPRGVDVAILSYYHPEVDKNSPAIKPTGADEMVTDEAWLTRFRWDHAAALASLAERLEPRQLVLGHLYELGHGPNMLWRFLDVGLTREALFSRRPEMGVHALTPGQSLPLLPPLG
jgi:L-ascorbate metabolism protein UlaG (beta-lactamase superfamily)